MKNINFQGLKVTKFSKNELYKDIINSLYNNRPKIYYGYSLGFLPKLKENKGLLELCNTFDVMVTDGRPFYLLLKLFKTDILSDISIPQLVYVSLSIANKYKLKVFFWGGTEVVNKNAIKNVILNYPNISDIRGVNGYYNKSDEQMIINKIKIFNPDIIYLTLSSPTKEYLAYKLREKEISKIIIPCGGMIDVLAGKNKLSPIFIKKIGFAWLYRLIQDKKRLPLTIKFFKLSIIIIFKIFLDIIFYKSNNAIIKYINDHIRPK